MTIATPVAPVRVVPAGPAGEIAPAKDVGRLLRHGEMFGAHKIEIRHLPGPLVVTSGRIAITDPRDPRTARVLARQVAGGRYRVMVSVATMDGEPRIAAVVLHVGRPPIARWVIAHHEGGKPPKTPEQAPVVEITGTFAAVMDAVVLDALPADALVAKLTAVTPSTAATADWTPVEADARNLVGCTSGWGKGGYAAAWALDDKAQPVCLVIDFDLFTKADWKPPRKK